jgi:hypothetical protein
MPAPAIATKTSAQPKAATPALEERIRIRAYERYLERAGQDGSEMTDWLEAEDEIRQEENLAR